MLAQADGGVSLFLCVCLCEQVTRDAVNPAASDVVVSHTPQTHHPVGSRWPTSTAEVMKVYMCVEVQLPRHSFSLNTQTKFARAHTTDGLPP